MSTEAKNLTAEAERIREAYAQRDVSGKGRLYAWSRPDVLFSQFRFKAAVASALIDSGWMDWAGKECLDVGCGTGGWLRTLHEWGGEPSRLHGVDLLPDRIEKARSLSPNLDFQVSTCWPMPFDDKSMHLVSAHTVFSSILDDEARDALAREMSRVVRDDGLILVYDFRVSDPRNPDTLGIGKKEMQRMFPGFLVKMRTVTLAPPIVRRVAGFSLLLAGVLESLPFLRTHAVYVLTKSS